MKIKIELSEQEPTDVYKFKYLLWGDRMAYALNAINELVSVAGSNEDQTYDELVGKIMLLIDDIGVDINELVI